MNKRTLAVITPILLPVVYYIAMIVDFNGPGLPVPSHQLGKNVFLPSLFIIVVWTIWENRRSLLWIMMYLPIPIFSAFVINALSGIAWRVSSGVG